ncbi:MAG: amidohydrolase family protein [Myxococcota bacterium]
MTDHPVIDADGHVFEPDWIWERYLDPRFVDQRPKLVRDERGTTRYELSGLTIPPGTGPGAWAPEGIQEASLHREGGVDPKARLVDMDTEGIDTAVLFGSFGLALWIAPDPDLGAALCRAYNDWMADYCSTDASRLKATASLPLRSIEDSVIEARRAVTELGCVSLTLPVNILGKNPDDPEIFPLYELASELDVPITFHAGGGRFAEDRFTDAYAIAHTVCFPMDILFGLTTVLCGGVLERFPKLRVALLEAGCGFLPYYLERLDEHFEKRPGEMPITRSPSETFAEGRCVLSCEPEEKSLAFVTESVGADKIVYASDYPHWDCEFPNSVRAISERDEISDDVKRAILYENSQRLFNL